MKVSLKKAKHYGDMLHIDYDVVPLKVWRYGITIELEHGKVNTKTNVTNNDLLMTAKIALAHLLEYPDYYQRLEEMEEDADEYWSDKVKPQVTF